MGDLDVDTRVEFRDGHYVCELSRDWEIWGPNGGYLASIALRAAGATSRFDRPASIAVHYLGVAKFEQVRLEVTMLRAARTAESLRVSMTQEGKPILEALVWTVATLHGLEHDEVPRPDVPSHTELKTFAEISGLDQPPYRFWNNFLGKPVHWFRSTPPDGPLPPVVTNWFKCVPTATFADPFVDASRSLLLLDAWQWPAATRPHAHQGAGRFVAPTIDLAVNFHELAPKNEWLLVVAEAPIARDGLVGGKATVWSEDLRLLTSASGHLLCREIPLGAPSAA
jgi:acyl-CoA thioesterase-2